MFNSTDVIEATILFCLRCHCKDEINDDDNGHFNRWIWLQFMTHAAHECLSTEMKYLLLLLLLNSQSFSATQNQRKLNTKAKKTKEKPFLPWYEMKRKSMSPSSMASASIVMIDDINKNWTIQWLIGFFNRIMMAVFVFMLTYGKRARKDKEQWANNE